MLYAFKNNFYCLHLICEIEILRKQNINISILYEYLNEHVNNGTYSYRFPEFVRQKHRLQYPYCLLDLNKIKTIVKNQPSVHLYILEDILHCIQMIESGIEKRSFSSDNAKDWHSHVQSYLEVKYMCHRGRELLFLYLKQPLQHLLN